MSLLQLPSEVQLLIFEEIDNVFALRALALTSHAVRDSIFKHERILCQRVLINHVGELGLKHLLLTYDARQHLLSLPPRTGWTIAEQRRLLDRYDGFDDEQSITDLTMSKALSVARLFDAIDYFACHYAKEGLQSGHARYSSDVSQEPEPSKLEMLRIQRTLCRFELYCCLFTRPYRLFPELYFPLSLEGRKWKRTLFWDRYALWEHEQMACIHDYFQRRLTDCKETARDYETDTELTEDSAQNDSLARFRPCKSRPCNIRVNDNKGRHPFRNTTVASTRFRELTATLQSPPG